MPLNNLVFKIFPSSRIDKLNLIILEVWKLVVKPEGKFLQKRDYTDAK